MTMLITSAQLADLAEKFFVSNPELLASTMVSSRATLDDLVEAVLMKGYAEDEARRLIAEKLAKNDSQVWRELAASGWSGEKPKLTSVVAKFAVSAAAPVPYGQVFVQAHAVYESDPASPNKVFTDATPSGSFQIWIKDSYPAAKFFKPGKQYLFTITEA